MRINSKIASVCLVSVYVVGEQTGSSFERRTTTSSFTRENWCSPNVLSRQSIERSAGEQREKNGASSGVPTAAKIGKTCLHLVILFPCSQYQ